MAELQAIEGGRGSGGVALTAVSGPPAPAEWQAMKQQASVIAKSGLAPKAVSTPEKVLVIAMKGRELHIPPMLALSHIHIVEGKPTLSAELMTALVRRAGHKIRVVEWTDDACVLEGVRADDPGHAQRTSFTAEEAQRAGLLNKQVWKNYRQAMLFSRATSKLCRSQFADVLMGASYTPEELGATVNDEGEVVDAEPVAEERSEEHERILAEMADAMRSIAPAERPDKRTAWDYAFESPANARKSLDRLRKLAEQYPHEQALPPIDEEQDAETSDEEKAKAAEIEVLKALADERFADREVQLHGHQWLQREIGKPFKEMTRDEIRVLQNEMDGEGDADAR